MGNIQITTIIDNHSPHSPLYGEHGLSVLLEVNNKKILMDVGQSQLFAKNAKNLGIKLAEITDLVISHGHYDHTSGLTSFFDKNNSAKIYLHPDALKNKLNINKYIGIPTHLKPLLQQRATMVKTNTEISQGVHLITNAKIYNQELTNFHNMFVDESEKTIVDTFQDELFIAIIKNGHVNIITGCAHRGVTNIMQTAKDLFDLPINMVFGGLHLRSSGETRRQNIISKMEEIGLNKIVTNHCTGLLAFHEIKTKFQEKSFYGYIGESFSI
ncbi:MAG: MBL fold metallo-hydrolase [Candidatus Margulisbacteria bacterium]|nr:MBL fold metallo-hydrolase [Candidatus Margulisiibacteriota bacterium]